MWTGQAISWVRLVTLTDSCTWLVPFPFSPRSHLCLLVTFFPLPILILMNSTFQSNLLNTYGVFAMCRAVFYPLAVQYQTGRQGPCLESLYVVVEEGEGQGKQ